MGFPLVKRSYKEGEQRGGVERTGERMVKEVESKGGMHSI